MKKILLIILITISLLPANSRAADTYTLLEPLPCIEGVGTCTPGTVTNEMDINGYILYVYKFSIALAVFLAIVMIIWGGFLTMTSEVPFIKSEGKSKIWSAITGLAMVLISYLILQTIDPRLVNLDSNIPPIMIPPEDKQSIDNFNSKVAADLNTVYAENYIKIQDINNGLKDVDNEKASLKAQLDRKEITKEEYERRISEQNTKAADLSTNKSVIVASDNGLKNYTDIVSLIGTSDVDQSLLSKFTAPTVPNTTGSTPRPVDTQNTVQKSYNARINEILATNSNFDKIVVLEKQRDFYIKEIKEEVELKKTIDDKNTQILNAKLVFYQKELNSERVQNLSGLPADQYKNIMQTRINTINQALGK